MTPLRHAEQNQTGTVDGQKSAPFHFECPLTVFKADGAPEGKKRRIAGIISTDSADRQNERILQDGLSFDDFIQHGWFNDNHSAATTDILGYPESVKQFDVGDALPDGSTASAKGTWVEGYLLDTKKANDIWELAQSLAKTHRRLGYSVEGAIESRSGPDDSTIAKAKVRNVAITNCFPGDVAVSALARGISRRIYNGPVLDLELASGHKVTGTPNHPILTQLGWVALGSLDKGKHRICRAVGEAFKLPAVGNDVKQVVSRLDQIFDSAKISGGIEHVRPGAEGDFHGDGTDGDVNVVLAAGLLRNTGEASFLKLVGQESLAIANLKSESLLVKGHRLGKRLCLRASSFFGTFAAKCKNFLSGPHGKLASVFGRQISNYTGLFRNFVNPDARHIASLSQLATASACFVGSNDCAFRRSVSLVDMRSVDAFFSEEIDNRIGIDGDGSADFADARALGVETKRLGFLGISENNDARTVGIQPFDDVVDAGFADADSLGDSGARLPKFVALDDILSLVVRDFSGHVYNLDSVPGWYVANGILAKNCPVNTDSRLEILARSLDAQNSLLSRSMTLADSTGSAGPVRPNKAYTGQGAGQVLSRESFGAKPKKKRKSATLTRSEAVAYVQAKVPGCSEALARAIVFRTIQSKVHP